MQSSLFEYQIGGSLPATARSYAYRKADEALYKALTAGELCYILTARQMGKSSLRVRTMKRLQEAGTRCGVIDITLIGVDNIEPVQWYVGLIRRLIRIFELPTNFRSWWAAHSELSPVQNLSEFLEEELLEHVKSPIVIFIDEIDSLLKLEFSTDDFFALIRACYNSQAEKPLYHRLTFALIGVAVPSDLIKNPISTPFNIGRAIVLQGLEPSEAMPLARGLQGLVRNPSTVLENIIDWTGGQPFLTQKICALVVEFVLSRQQQRGQNESEMGVSALPFSEADLSALIRKEIINDWEIQDRPEHLKTIADRLLYNPLIASQVLGIHQQLLAGVAVTIDESLTQVTMRLSGLVTNRAGQLAISSRIYREVFDALWVETQLATLRPYADKILAWQRSIYADTAYLLKGLELKKSLAWAAKKRLSEEDYRFLAASQAVDKQAIEDDLVQEIEQREQVEFALKSTIEATQALARSRQQARSQIKGFGKRLAAIALGVTCTVTVVRWSGILQGLELGLLDQFFRWRPLASAASQDIGAKNVLNTQIDSRDSRVVLVTIDEPDIQTIGQYPIPDRALAKALTKIKQHQPRLIGLDIYRDLPVEPGHDELVKILETTPNLIGIEKVTGTPITPPPALRQAGRVGFADQLFDDDGTIRRALLSIQPDEQTLLLSFPLQLVIAYLAEEGITSEQTSEAVSAIQLGNALIKPLSSYDGSYIRADTRGYQVLLNYIGSQDQYSTFSLTQVLQDQVPSGAMRDRIVLLGSVSSTTNDLVVTPYTKRGAGYMAGVTVHANVVSMLLQESLDNRSPLWGWTEWQEILWIFLWAVVGTLAAGKWRRQPQIIALSVGGCLILLVGFSYGLFLLGWWIPAMPAGIGLVSAAIALPALTAQWLERATLEKITKELYALEQKEPTIAKIAITYLKQSENKTNQFWIEQVLDRQKHQR